MKESLLGRRTTFHDPIEEQRKALSESDGYLFTQEGDPAPIVKGAKPADGDPSGSNGSSISSADFSKMTYKERVKLKQDSPELYKSLSGQ